MFFLNRFSVRFKIFLDFFLLKLHVLQWLFSLALSESQFKKKKIHGEGIGKFFTFLAPCTFPGKGGMELGLGCGILLRIFSKQNKSADLHLSHHLNDQINF